MRLNEVLFIILCLCVGITAASGQVGLYGQYSLPLFSGKEEANPDPTVLGSWNIGVMYTFRKSSIRTEWIPNVSVQRTRLEGTTAPKSVMGYTAGIDFRIYPLDLYGDCMCPTFSRRGDVFQKGFFWEAGAGWVGMDKILNENSGLYHGFYGRIGAGIDIGINRHMTFTPGVRVQYIHEAHPWGATSAEKQYQPLWITPFVQWMFYLKN